MTAFLKLFELQRHRQVVQHTLLSSLALALITGFGIKFLWVGLFPGAVYPDVTSVQIVAFFVTFLIASPVLYGLFFMSLRVSRKNNELFQLANLDPLTGIYNRRAFADRYAMLARKARRNSEPGILLVIDVDHFKAVNDQYGHEAGDSVLIHMSEKLRVLGGEDCCFARLGGEEFAVARFGVDEASAHKFAERIRLGIEHSPLAQNKTIISCTVSIGYCLIGESDDLQSVLRQADAALYLAKRTGRNRSVKFVPDAVPLAPHADDLAPVTPNRLDSHLASSN